MSKKKHAPQGNLYRMEKLRDGEWVPVRQKNKDGEYEDRVIRTEQKHIDTLMRDSKRIGIRYVKLAEKKETVSVEDMNVMQLKAYAKHNEIDLGDAKKKAEILEVIAANESE